MGLFRDDTVNPNVAPPYAGLLWRANLAGPPARNLMWTSMGTSSVDDWVLQTGTVIVASGVPAHTPDAIGQQYLNSDTDILYISKGTTSPGSWQEIAGGGASTGPTVTSISPNSGPDGTFVTITGQNFTGATAVTFNGTAAASFTVNSNTQITAESPTGVTTGKIVVTTPNGTAESSEDYTVPGGTINDYAYAWPFEIGVSNFTDIVNSLAFSETLNVSLQASGGVFNDAPNFIADTTNRYMDQVITGLSNISDTSQPFTWVMLVDFDTFIAGANQVLMDMVDGSGTVHRLTHNNDTTTLTFSIKNTSSTFFEVQTSSQPAGNYQLIAFYFNGSSESGISVNAENWVTNNTFTGTAVSSLFKFRIGRQAVAQTDPIDGRVDQLIYYPRVLLQSELALIYNGGSFLELPYT